MITLATRRLLPVIGLVGFACLPGAARAGGHCATGASITAIAGRPGTFRIATAGAIATARWPAPAPVNSAPPAYVIRALGDRWDADGNPESETDTLVVTAGSTVRWQLVSGIHTLTDGKDSGDPGAGIGFDYLLDEQHPWFDSTFTAPDTLEYFCFFHEPRMRGVLIVSGSASVPDPLPPSRLHFTRPPRPNPSRGTVSFDIGAPREQIVRIEVLDAHGRRVALLHDGPLAAGDHPFRWRGTTDRGERARVGLYIVHLRSADVTAMRRVTLLR